MSADGNAIRLAAANRRLMALTAAWASVRLAAAGTAACISVGVVLFMGCSRNEPAKSTPPVHSLSETVLETLPPPAPPAAPTSPAPQASNVVQTKAAVGSGVKGRGYGIGPIATPCASYFCVRERLAYEVQIPEAMKLFKATEDRVPKSHEEFMQRIIKENHINLPLLPEGHKYVYDPKRGELMVEQPAE